MHSVFPPNMDTPGFEIENKTKPAVAKAIEAGEPTHDPAKVAAAVLAGLERGRFNIACGDLGLGLLVRATSGLAPRATPLMDLVVLPLIACVAFVYRRVWDYIVLREATEAPPPPVEEAPPAEEAYFPLLNSLVASPSEKKDAAAPEDS